MSAFAKKPRWEMIGNYTMSLEFNDNKNKMLCYNMEFSAFDRKDIFFNELEKTLFRLLKTIDEKHGYIPKNFKVGIKGSCSHEIKKLIRDVECFYMTIDNMKNNFLRTHPWYIIR